MARQDVVATGADAPAVDPGRRPGPCPPLRLGKSLRPGLGLSLLRALFVGLGLALSQSTLALGVPNVAQTPGTLISGPNAPEAGRTPVIAFHGDMLLTFPEAPGSPPGDFQVRAWDISDPADPVVTQMLGFTRHGFMAHGFIKRGELINSGYTFDVDATGGVSETPGIDFRMLGWTHGGMSVPWGVTNYWSYGDTSQPAEIYLDQNYGAPPLATFNPVGDTGVIGHPFIFGRYLFFASDQSRSGIASYDISDPANPVLLDVLADGAVGGYWPDPVGINGRLYFFFPHDNPEGGFHVVDATDPTDLRLVADVPLEGNLNYAQFQDEFAFAERYKIDMRTFEVVLALDEDADNRSGDPIDTSQFSLPVGNLVITGGIFTGGNCNVPGFNSNHCGTGMSIWAHQAAPDTRGPFVGYHAPAGGETNFPVSHPIQILIHETLKSETINAATVRLTPLINGEPGPQVAADYWFASNDILSIVPQADLASDTVYRVELVAGGIEDAVGNGMQPYSFEFSTGSALAGANVPPTITALSTTPTPVPPGGSANVTVSAFDADGDDIEYRYDFGDGSPATDWLSSNEAAHAYAQPGHYTLTVQVRDPLSSVSSATTVVSVLTATADLSGTHDSHIAWTDDGANSYAWVVNPDNDSISQLDGDSLAHLAEYRTCRDPRSVAADAQQYLWISCFDSDELLIMGTDGATVALLELDYGDAPFAVVMNGDASRALVSLQGAGELALFDTATLGELDRLALGPEPRAIAWTAAGDRALVTRFISPAMHGEVWDIAVGGASLALNGTITLGHQWGEDLRFDGRGVPNYLAAIAITRDGSRAWVAAKKDNTTRGLYFSGEDLDQDNTVRAMIAQIDLATGTEREDLRRDLDNAAEPRAIAFSPLGDYAFVAMQGSNAVKVLDTLKIDAGFSGVSSVVSRVQVGNAPQALFYDERAGGDRLLVHDFLERRLTALDLGAFIASGAASFPLSHTALVGNEQLAPAVLSGKRVFYDAADPRMSGEGYLGCATCHVDGGHDGRTWDFTGRGEGLRNTTSLRGRAGMGHGLVHWSANFDEIQDFEHDIRGPFGGAGFLSDSDFAAASTPLGPPKAGLSAELDNLAAYLASLDLNTVPRSPHRAADGGLSAAGQRGAVLFQSLNCASCHAGTAGVSSTALTPDLQDVGSHGSRSGSRLSGALAGIDTPTLHGLWRGAPYLHSGEAVTLAEVFTRTGASALQAESAALSGSHEVRDSGHWSLQDLAVVREGAFVHMNGGATATFSYNAASAGSATLALRYHANYQDAAVTLTINGTPQALVLPRTLSNDWPYRSWGEYEMPVTLGAGDNTLALRYDSGANFALDEISLRDTAELLAASNPHAVAGTLDPSDFDDLLAYLLEQDGRPAQPLFATLSYPANGDTVSGDFALSGTSSGSGADQVLVAIDTGAFVPADGVANWSLPVAAAALAPGWHTATVRVVDEETGTFEELQQQFFVSESTVEAPQVVPAVPVLAWWLLATMLVAARRGVQRVVRRP